MADDNFRPYRGRDPLAPRSADAPARGQIDDPLAELARLIGQSEPMNDFGRDARHGSAASLDEPAGGLDWAVDDRYAEPHEPAQGGYQDIMQTVTQHAPTNATSRRALPTLIRRIVPMLSRMTAITKLSMPVSSRIIGTRKNRRTPSAGCQPSCLARAPVVTATTRRRMALTIKLTRWRTTRRKPPTVAGGAVSLL